MTRVVILGGGYAGVMAALRLSGRSGRGAAVTLVNERAAFVERIRLHERAAGRRVPARSLARMLRGTRTRLVVDRAVRLDPARRTVTLGGGGELRYDLLIYALGSARRDGPIPGLAEHAYDVATEPGAVALASRLDAARRGASVCVIGAGLTGVELATELAEARPSLRVTLVARGPVGAGLSEAGSEALGAALRELGVRVVEHAAVRAVGSGAVETSDGGRLDADVSVWCGGLAAAPLAREAGLATTPSGALAVDAELRALGAPDILGAGDGAAIVAPRPLPLRMACATALPLGAHAADNALRALAGGELTPFRFAYALRCLSLGRERGLIQRVARDDTPSHGVVAGAAGARIKGSVCRYTTAVLAIERLLPGSYTWPGRRSTEPAIEAMLT
ncbi:MAG: FAD-dependent oxidoreductase [Polyangiaceae bacterium]|nr:FAD-dependent oxidoreductase [Polyangiaceae bacterium]